MKVSVEQIVPMPGRALVEVVRSGHDEEITASGIAVVRDGSVTGWRPERDWEEARVVALGSGDFDPVEVGDTVLIRGKSGGVAGADVSHVAGAQRGALVMVEAEELLCRVV